MSLCGRCTTNRHIIKIFLQYLVGGTHLELTALVSIIAALASHDAVRVPGSQRPQAPVGRQISTVFEKNKHLCEIVTVGERVVPLRDCRDDTLRTFRNLRLWTPT